MVWTDRKFDQQSQRQGDHRSSFQRDKARVLHSAAFRRLQAKTQVLGVGMSDFYRTRLTHSLEASQIGQGIAAQLRSKHPQLTETLNLNEQLIEALCLAHDIGHPPFGHGGEVALNYMMRDFGGFEGNGQTFRIVTKLEPYTAEAGMNLSRRTVLGLIKYPNYLDTLTNKHCLNVEPTGKHIKASDWLPAKGLFTCDSNMLDWVLAPLCDQDKCDFCDYTMIEGKHSKTIRKSFDCSIMELADDIAYGIHDLEDAIVMGIVNVQQFSDEVVAPIQSLSLPWLSESMTLIAQKLFSHEHHERKDAIGALVNGFITAIEIYRVEADFKEPLLQYNAHLPERYEAALAEFKRFVYRRVIRKPEIQLLEYKGQMVVMELFDAFASDPGRLLPENTRERWRKADNEGYGERVIADYISGMTDEYAARLYNNLFTPKGGGLADTLGA